MTKPKLILCVGLQRSGNHAILGWVEALFPGTVFHNDQFHDLFADAHLGGQAPYAVYRMALASGLFESLGQVNSLGLLRRL